MTDFFELARTRTTIGALLSGLVEQAKAERPGLSLGALSKAAGLGSKGYLSEVLRGLRVPKPVTVEAVGKALGLQGVPLKYLMTLAARDSETDPARRTVLNQELAAVLKALQVGVAPMPEDARLSGFAIEVFCAFGLYHGRPTREELVRYFGRARAFEVDRALQELARGGFVEEDGERYALREDTRHFAFDESRGGVRHLEFLRHAILSAAAAAEDWFSRKAESHFESMILSVRRTDYCVALQRLKADLLAWESALETHEADTLIRLNVQIHPLEDPRG